MRSGSVRIRSGEVDVTDIALARMGEDRRQDMIDFLHKTLNYTESRLKELFGDDLVLSPESQ